MQTATESTPARGGCPVTHSAGLRRLILCSVATLLLTVTAWPQASTGMVSGTIKDRTGALIPSASVTLTNTATNVSAKTLANRAGF